MFKAIAVALPLSLMAAGAWISTANAGQVYYAPSYFYAPRYVDIWINTSSQYQDAHGRYASQSDFLRDLNGTPCGIECNREHARDWYGHR